MPFLLNIKMCFLWGGFSDDCLLCRNRRGRLSRLSDNPCARMKVEAGPVLSGVFIYRARALFLSQARRSVCQPLTHRAHAHSLVPDLPGDCPAVSDRDQNSLGEMETQEEHYGLKGSFCSAMFTVGLIQFSGALPNSEPWPPREKMFHAVFSA